MDQHNQKDRNEHRQPEGLKAAAVAYETTEINADLIAAELFAEGKRRKDDKRKVDRILRKQRPVRQKVEKHQADRREEAEVKIIDAEVINNAVGIFEIVDQHIGDHQYQNEEQRPVVIEKSQNADRGEAYHKKAEMQEVQRFRIKRRYGKENGEGSIQNKRRYQRILHQRYDLF